MSICGGITITNTSISTTLYLFPTSIKSTKQVVKEISLNERKIEIAHARGLSTDLLLKYDLVHSLLLYKEDHMSKPEKSQLMNGSRSG